MSLACSPQQTNDGTNAGRCYLEAHLLRLGEQVLLEVEVGDVRPRHHLQLGGAVARRRQLRQQPVEVALVVVDELDRSREADALLDLHAAARLPLDAVVVHPARDAGRHHHHHVNTDHRHPALIRPRVVRLTGVTCRYRSR